MKKLMIIAAVLMMTVANANAQKNLTQSEMSNALTLTLTKSMKSTADNNRAAAKKANAVTCNQYRETANFFDNDGNPIGIDDGGHLVTKVGNREIARDENGKVVPVEGNVEYDFTTRFWNVEGWYFGVGGQWQSFAGANNFGPYANFGWQAKHWRFDGHASYNKEKWGPRDITKGNFESIMWGAGVAYGFDIPIKGIYRQTFRLELEAGLDAHYNRAIEPNGEYGEVHMNAFGLAPYAAARMQILLSAKAGLRLVGGYEFHRAKKEDFDGGVYHNMHVVKVGFTLSPAAWSKKTTDLGKTISALKGY